jgi:flavin reductase (DIM6/NTAB) family NADH-FMN oxidoreductase RutF
VLEAAAAWLDCSVRHHLALGSHGLFVGEVTDCGVGPPGSPDDAAVSGELLRMEDTRMNYGG